MECKIDNAFNLQDLVLQELVKIMEYITKEILKKLRSAKLTQIFINVPQLAKSYAMNYHMPHFD